MSFRRQFQWCITLECKSSLRSLNSFLWCVFVEKWRDWENDRWIDRGRKKESVTILAQALPKYFVSHKCLKMHKYKHKHLVSDWCYKHLSLMIKICHHKHFSVKMTICHHKHFSSLFAATSTSHYLIWKFFKKHPKSAWARWSACGACVFPTQI